MLSSLRSCRNRCSVFNPGVVGEQSVVADAMKAGGQHVNKEAPDELVAWPGSGSCNDHATGRDSPST